MIPVEKNSVINLDINSFGSDGQGIGRYDGFAVFVPYALPGENITAHIIKVTASYAVGKLKSINMPSPERIQPQCPYFYKCGGCMLQHMNYDAQLTAKRDQIVSALARIGRINCAESLVKPVIGMKKPFRYRNKGAFPAGTDEAGVAFGLYAQRTHRVIPIQDCLLQHEYCMSTVHAVQGWARQYRVPEYNEAINTGALRHLVVRTSSKGDLMATIITSGALHHKEALIDAIRQRSPSVCSIMHSVNSARTNVIFGKSIEKLWGAPSIRENICGLDFEVSPLSFMQVNHAQTERLYSAVLDYCALSNAETVVDAYCGTGTISLLLAGKAQSIIGIEIVEEAVADARKNAVTNGISNVKFICAKAEDALPKLVADGLSPHAIVLDPPRKGCDASLLDAVIAAKPARVVYVSCNPATLARDAYTLSQSYCLAEVQGFDMFPQTSSIESVALFKCSAK